MIDGGIIRPGYGKMPHPISTFHSTPDLPSHANHAKSHAKPKMPQPTMATVDDRRACRVRVIRPAVRVFNAQGG